MSHNESGDRPGRRGAGCAGDHSGRETDLRSAGRNGARAHTPEGRPHTHRGSSPGHGSHGSHHASHGSRPPTGKEGRPPKSRVGAPYHLRRKSGRWRHTYAAIDLGTNNCRLLVAKPQRRGFRVIDAFSRSVRLGEGVEQTGSLSPDAMDRAVEALKVCANKIRYRRVTRTRAIATEACRLADNGTEFIARVARETGLSLDIIPADEEARLAVIGCSSLVDLSEEGVLIFDIGGGSTELVWLDLRRRDEHCREGTGIGAMCAWASLPYGVVNLAERYGGGDVSSAIYRDMVEEVMEALSVIEEAEVLRPVFAAGRAHMLGTSGTVTTLAGVYLGLERYDRSRVDGVWVDVPKLREIADQLTRMSHVERAAQPCIGRGRADLVVAGCAILEAIDRVWPCRRMRVADRGLREGMLLALMERADRERGGRPRRPRRHPPRPASKTI